MKETERETAVVGEEPTKYQQGSTHDWPKTLQPNGGVRGGRGGGQRRDKSGAPPPTTKNRSDTTTKQKSSSHLTNPANRIKCLKEGGEREGEPHRAGTKNGTPKPHPRGGAGAGRAGQPVLRRAASRWCLLSGWVGILAPARCRMLVGSRSCGGAGAPRAGVPVPLGEPVLCLRPHRLESAPPCLKKRKV